MRWRVLTLALPTAFGGGPLPSPKGRGRVVRVLSVASEAFPLVKTGGLADVVGALPAALAPHGVSVTTLIPGYPQVAGAVKGRALCKWADLMGVQARLLGGEIGGHPLLVLDAPQLFARPGGLYGDAAGQDWADNWRRFAALSRAAADIAGGMVKGRAFDIVHAHDWQAAMAPAYLRYRGSAVRSVVTVHNIAFQGRFEAAVFPALGLPAEAWALDGVEYYGGVGFLKAGLAAADAITTVSPTYAQEIRTPAFGMGLEGLIATRAAAGAVTGIANGIDPAVWNPATDPALPARYNRPHAGEARGEPRRGGADVRPRRRRRADLHRDQPADLAEGHGPACRLPRRSGGDGRAAGDARFGRCRAGKCVPRRG